MSTNYTHIGGKCGRKQSNLLLFYGLGALFFEKQIAQQNSRNSLDVSDRPIIVTSVCWKLTPADGFEPDNLVVAAARLRKPNPNSDRSPEFQPRGMARKLNAG
jgi:hypothetical protein